MRKSALANAEIRLSFLVNTNLKNRDIYIAKKIKKLFGTFKKFMYNGSIRTDNNNFKTIMNTKQHMTTEQVAENIKKNLRKSFSHYSDYFSMLWTVRKIAMMKKTIRMSELYKWWLDKANQDDIYSSDISFLTSLNSLPKYFKVEVEANQDTNYFDTSKVSIFKSDGFKQYIDSLEDDDRKKLAECLLYTKDEVLYEMGKEKIRIEINKGKNKDNDNYSIPTVLHQYDDPLPSNWKQMSIKEQVEWETEHDILLNEMLQTKK